MAQIVLKHTTVARGGAHRGLEEAIDSAPFVLGAVEGGVGVCEQALRSVASSGQMAIPMLVDDQGVGFCFGIGGLQVVQDVFGNTTG